MDTAVVTASVCLSENGVIKGILKNETQAESASWLHVAIQELVREAGASVQDLAAVAVSAGPGSYTGLRIGMAAAKGLCYALHIPLIAVSTLGMMAAAARALPVQLLCPMIDARRMEVFTAVFTKELAEVLPAQALVLQADFFASLLANRSVAFFGNGSDKFKALMQHPSAMFANVDADARHVAELAGRDYIQKKFANLAYGQPYYGKEFFSPPRKQ